MALRSKFVTSYAQKWGLTHFLAIPLVTPTSRTQFRDSFKCLRDDLAAIGGPTKAIRPLGLLHLSLDIPLSLKTSAQIAQATEILHEVSIKQIQRTSHKSSTSGNLHRHFASASPTSKDDINNSMASPSVSISSLFCTPGKEAETFSLSTKVYDSTHRVRDWKLRLAQAYNAAGLSRKSTPPKDPRIRLPSYDATVRLINVPSSTEAIPARRYPEKLVKKMLPPFDARGLLERYKDHVWMETAPLERVSICKIGFRRLGAKELLEEFSVPL